ncbi:hypothetical protein E5J99_09810 [Hymenobacter elongatus]|uniref:Uncharacterized protein n=1 Tax=Hymenobacter elongatus TaxID=877208 RepID=A0A4Z0PLK0_9BACT|nr:hypothetical protein E5J99_09810 [Hymenobacter elongatus]
MNVRLIYKRWFETGTSKIFDVVAYDKYTLSSVVSNEMEQLKKSESFFRRCLLGNVVFFRRVLRVNRKYI